MDIISYALSKKIASSAVSGISSMSVDGTTLNINTNDGNVLQIVFPTPKDGVSIVDIDINENNELVFQMSDGSEIAAGEIGVIKGETPEKGVDYWTEEDKAEILYNIENIPNSKFKIGKFVDFSGKYADYPTFATSGFISVNNGEVIFNKSQIEDSEGRQLFISIATYTNDYEYIEGFYIQRPTLNVYEHKTVFGSNVSFIRISIGRAAAGGITFTESDFELFSLSTGVSNYQKAIDKITPYDTESSIERKISNYAVKSAQTPWVVQHDNMFKMLFNDGTWSSAQFGADTECTGVPYGTAYGRGEDVFFNRTLSTFYSAANSIASILYSTSTAIRPTGHDSAYYAGVCSTLVSKIANTPIWYETSEIKNKLIEKRIDDVEDLQIGDILWRTGHVGFISNLDTDPETGEIRHVAFTDEYPPLTQTILYTPSDFLAELQQNGGRYIVGRLPGQAYPKTERIRYSDTICPEYGDRTYYRATGLDGSVSVAGGLYIHIFNDSHTTVYYRKKGVATWSNVSVDTLATKTRNGVTLYDISPVLKNYAVYEITTDRSMIPAEVKIINVGTIALSSSGGITITGYSDNIQPIWYQVAKGTSLKLGDENKGLVEGNNMQMVYTPETGTHIRVFFDTGYGQAMGVSNVI